MAAFYLVLYLLAAVLFLFAAVPATPEKASLMALGLLAWVLVPLIQAARGMR